MNHATGRGACELLRKLDISFQKVDHLTIIPAKSIPLPLFGPQVKNLLSRSRKGKRIYLIISPDEKYADLKQLAEQLKERRLSFVSEEQPLDLLGIPADIATPLALVHDTEKRIQVVIDSTIGRQDTVGFHPNINTVTLIMDFPDFEKILTYSEHLPVYGNL